MKRNAFTLIELLVVIAIIAILSVVVVLTLNPAQLLMQGRDANRVSDMATLNSALGIFSAQGGSSLGTANTVYVSIPDPIATSTAGDQCQGIGLPAMPPAYTYHCAASSTYRNNDGTGWIPVAFNSLPAGSPLGQLPIDPINASSSRLYYTYDTTGSQFEVTSVMESQKYQLGGSNDVIGTDGGTLTSVYEKGSKLGLEPMDYGDNTLAGYWTLDEGTGSIAYDYSGNNATGSWQGTLGSQWASGRVGPFAGNFNGTNNDVNIPIFMSPGTGSVTLASWEKTSATSSQAFIILPGGASYLLTQFGQFGNNLVLNAYDGTNNPRATASVNIADGQWHYVVGVRNTANHTLSIYLDGVFLASSADNTNSIAGGGAEIGAHDFGGTFYPNGLVDDARVYSRALSAAQIAAMYAGGK